jgi:cysteinyl-tRNA synthetase
MLRLYDTASRSVEEVQNYEGLVSIYCCGPTVYRDAHVGNLRTFLLSDLVTRAIEIAGLKVQLVQNITDVGHMAENLEADKMLEQAKLEDVDPFAIARKYEERFHTDLDRLNIQPADQYPHASQSIELMHAMIAKLIDRGNAYVGDDKSVYFAAQSFESYGEISGNRLDALKPGHRYEYVEGGAKRFHADWALWKAAGNRTEMIWDSPWGPGFPGWHIECSAMSLHHLLGDDEQRKINLHIGGIDLRFPHHENERAQTNSITGSECVDLWLHGEHLLFEGRKMSKSAGNVVLLGDLIERGFDPLSLRLCFLENRYRSQMDLSWDSIAAAHATIKRWRTKLAQWGQASSIEDADFIRAIMNDLDTPRAIMRMREIEKDSELSDSQKAALFIFAEKFVGLDLDRPIELRELSDEASALLAARAKAREDKEWAESDHLRGLLEDLGLEIKDLKDGQHWEWK